MTYKQQLTDLLCTVPEIEKQIKELKFGCIVNDTNYGTGLSQIFGELGRNFIVKRFEDLSKPYIERKGDIEDWEKIGNPIEYHHLMMYCESKKIKFDIKQFCGEGTIFINTDRIVKFDSTKPLSEQSEEVYEKILIALKGA